MHIKGQDWKISRHQIMFYYECWQTLTSNVARWKLLQTPYICKSHILETLKCRIWSQRWEFSVLIRNRRNCTSICNWLSVNFILLGDKKTNKIVTLLNQYHAVRTSSNGTLSIASWISRRNRNILRPDNDKHSN